MSNQLGRLTQRILTNKSGGAVALGDVVVIDTANAEAFDTTTTAAYTDTPVGVVIEPNGIADNAQGMVAIGVGPVGVINLDGAAAIGDWIKTSTVAGQGTPHAAPPAAGDFAVALEASATPQCILISGGGGGSGGGGDSLVLTLTNQTGVTVNLGDVVYLDDSDADSFNYIALARYDAYAFGVVADASIANNAAGLVCMGGYVSQINLTASASIGSHIYVSGSVAGQGTPEAVMSYGSGFPWDSGDFAVALDSGTTPSALIFNPPIPMGERLLVKNKSLNMNTSTAITLFTVPTGRTCVITKFIFRDPTASLTTVSWSVGWNSATFNNVLANATHTELTGSGLYTILFPKIGAATGAAAGILKLLNNTLQGSGATLFCEIYGYLF